jgi:hypothetical protein
MSVLNRCVPTGKLIHQASPQFECLSLPRRRKRASDPVDSHAAADRAKCTTSAAPLLLRDPDSVRLAVAADGPSVAQWYREPCAIAAMGRSGRAVWCRRGCRGNRVGARDWRSLAFVEGNCHIDGVARAWALAPATPILHNAHHYLVFVPRTSIMVSHFTELRDHVLIPAGSLRICRIYAASSSMLAATPKRAPTRGRRYVRPMILLRCACLMLNWVPSSTILRFSCHPLQYSV